MQRPSMRTQKMVWLADSRITRACKKHERLRAEPIADTISCSSDALRPNVFSNPGNKFTRIFTVSTVNRSRVTRSTASLRRNLLLNNIYVVLFIKGRIILSVWPIYTLFVFRLRLCIHNIQIIQNSSLLFSIWSQLI
jgi:hypothetical protein